MNTKETIAALAQKSHLAVFRLIKFTLLTRDVSPFSSTLTASAEKVPQN